MARNVRGLGEGTAALVAFMNLGRSPSVSRSSKYSLHHRPEPKSVVLSFAPLSTCATLTKTMRRDFSSLLHSRTEGEVDARKRRRLESKKSEDDRAERVERATAARVAQMQQWIDKWDVFNAVSASEYQLVPPAPNPLGLPSPPHSIPHSTLSSSTPPLLLSRHFPGATTNPTHIGRHCSRLECMKAFLPAETVEQIALQVSDSIHRRLKRGDLMFNHHLHPVTPHDIWTWIYQRLIFSLEKRKTLRDQFNSVRSHDSVRFPGHP